MPSAILTGFSLLQAKSEAAAFKARFEKSLDADLKIHDLKLELARVQKDNRSLKSRNDSLTIRTDNLLKERDESQETEVKLRVSIEVLEDKEVQLQEALDRLEGRAVQLEHGTREAIFQRDEIRLELDAFLCSYNAIKDRLAKLEKKPEESIDQ